MSLEHTDLPLHDLEPQQARQKAFRAQGKESEQTFSENWSEPGENSLMVNVCFPHSAHSDTMLRTTSQPRTDNPGLV